MTDKAKGELKPCPFCGGQAKFIKCTASICCDGCGIALVDTLTKKDLIKTWNARPTEPAVEAVRAARDILYDAPELNLSNYDHEQVCELNSKTCEAFLVIDGAVGEIELAEENRATAKLQQNGEE